jgi:hypothetical protein
MGFTGIIALRSVMAVLYAVKQMELVEHIARWVNGVPTAKSPALKAAKTTIVSKEPVSAKPVNKIIGIYQTTVIRNAASIAKNRKDV